LTQTEVARRLGISQPTLNRLENAAQNTTLKTLGALYRALGCGVGELFGGDVSLGRSRPGREARLGTRHKRSSAAR